MNWAFLHQLANKKMHHGPIWWRQFFSGVPSPPPKWLWVRVKLTAEANYSEVRVNCFQPLKAHALDSVEGALTSPAPNHLPTHFSILSPSSHSVTTKGKHCLFRCILLAPLLSGKMSANLKYCLFIKGKFKITLVFTTRKPSSPQVAPMARQGVFCNSATYLFFFFFEDEHTALHMLYMQCTTEPHW